MNSNGRWDLKPGWNGELGQGLQRNTSSESNIQQGMDLAEMEMPEVVEKGNNKRNSNKNEGKINRMR